MTAVGPWGAHRLSISGVGHVGFHGCGRDALANALVAGQAPRWEGDRPALLASGVDLNSWVSPRQARRMSPPSRFAVAAARMALEDAVLGGVGADALRPPVAVVAATSFGPASFTEGILHQIFGQGPEAVSPFFFTESVTNAAAAQVALALGARGPNVTLTGREAGPLLALNRAAREIVLGRAGSAIVLAVDEMTPMLLEILDRFGMLTASTARPFDDARDGILPAEGASALVLESSTAVEARDGCSLARLLGGFGGFDPTATAASWGRDPQGLASTVERGLARFGLASTDLTAVVSGASGSVAGDALEDHLWTQLFGAGRPPMVCPKAIVGEYGGGFLAASVLAASSWADEAEATPVRCLVSSLAVGGAGAWVVLGDGHG